MKIIQWNQCLKLLEMWINWMKLFLCFNCCLDFCSDFNSKIIANKSWVLNRSQLLYHLRLDLIAQLLFQKIPGNKNQTLITLISKKTKGDNKRKKDMAKSGKRRGDPWGHKKNRKMRKVLTAIASGALIGVTAVAVYVAINWYMKWIRVRND